MFFYSPIKESTYGYHVIPDIGPDRTLSYYPSIKRSIDWKDRLFTEEFNSRVSQLLKIEQFHRDQWKCTRVKQHPWMTKPFGRSMENDNMMFWYMYKWFIDHGEGFARWWKLELIRLWYTLCVTDRALIAKYMGLQAAAADIQTKPIDGRWIITTTATEDFNSKAYKLPRTIFDNALLCLKSMQWAEDETCHRSYTTSLQRRLHSSQWMNGVISEDALPMVMLGFFDKLYGPDSNFYKSRKRPLESIGDPDMAKRLHVVKTSQAPLPPYAFKPADVANPIAYMQQVVLGKEKPESKDVIQSIHQIHMPLCIQNITRVYSKGAVVSKKARGMAMSYLAYIIRDVDALKAEYSRLFRNIPDGDLEEEAIGFIAKGDANQWGCQAFIKEGLCGYDGNGKHLIKLLSDAGFGLEEDQVETIQNVKTTEDKMNACAMVTSHTVSHMIKRGKRKVGFRGKLEHELKVFIKRPVAIGQWLMHADQLSKVVK